VVESTTGGTAQRSTVPCDFLINATGPKPNFAATPGPGPGGNSLSVCTPDHAAESAGANPFTGTAAAMTVFPVVPDFDRYPEYGRDLDLTFGEIGLAGHWIKIILHHMFLYKARLLPGWRLIPEQDHGRPGPPRARRAPERGVLRDQADTLDRLPAHLPAVAAVALRGDQPADVQDHRPQPRRASLRCCAAGSICLVPPG
jgi:hypothetical protein